MQRNDGMAAIVLPPGQAHITHHADETAAGNKRAETMRPNFVEFGEELVVVVDVPHLPFRIPVFL